MSDIRNIAIVLAIFGFGWWFLNRQAQMQQPELTPTPTTPAPLVSADLLDKKFNLSKCEGVLPAASIRAGKGECIQAGSKYGVVVTLPDKRRCTIKCSTIATYTTELKKQMGIDKCKCTALDRQDLENELVKSSYTSFRVTIA